MARTLKNSVIAGAKKLDELRPGWEEKIDQSTLNMRWGDTCILGQILGSYFNFKEIFPDGKSFGKSILTDLGFQVVANHRTKAEAEALDHQYVTLKRYWIQEIQKRSENSCPKDTQD